MLLGSGVSRAAGIPTGWEVVLDLINRVAALEGADTASDPAAWYQQTYGTSPDYSDLLEQLAKTPASRRQLLRAYFEPTAEELEQGLKQPTAAHHAIARLVASGRIRVIGCGSGFIAPCTFAASSIRISATSAARPATPTNRTVYAPRRTASSKSVPADGATDGAKALVNGSVEPNTTGLESRHQGQP